MEEEKPSPLTDVNGGIGGGSTRPAASEETRFGRSQNGEAEEEEEEAAGAEKIGCKRRNSRLNSEPPNSAVKGDSTPTEEPPRKRFQIPKKSREKKGCRHLLLYS